MPPSRGGRSPARAVTAHGRCGIRAVTAHVRCGIGSWGALGGRCLRMADYVRRLAATRAPPPQRANVGYALTNRVGALAEADSHHPALLTEWGQVTVAWWTHKIRGLHRKDFVMAAKTDALLAE